MRRSPASVALSIAVTFAAASLASAAPTAAPKSWVVSPMRVRTVPAVTYFATTREATYASLAKVLPAATDSLRKNLAEAKVAPSSGLVLVYRDAPARGSAPFKLDIGFPVASGSAGAGDCTVRELPAGRFASVVFTGPVTAMGEAYAQLYAAMFKAQLQPGGERRESYLLFEPSGTGGECVILLEVAVK